MGVFFLMCIGVDDRGLSVLSCCFFNVLIKYNEVKWLSGVFGIIGSVIVLNFKLKLGGLGFIIKFVMKFVLVLELGIKWLIDGLSFIICLEIYWLLIMSFVGILQVKWLILLFMLFLIFGMRVFKLIVNKVIVLNMMSNKIGVGKLFIWWVSDVVFFLIFLLMSLFLWLWLDFILGFC